jgi:hypothetical protein
MYHKRGTCTTNSPEALESYLRVLRFFDLASELSDVSKPCRVPCDILFKYKLLTRKSSGGHQAKKKEGGKKKSKPEEQEGMPQHQHCPPEKRRGDKNIL